MKQLTCEMCGSTDLMKQDGVFVCQACGTKYSVEEAKKMMVEGSVDVSGSTVKIDASDEVANLYQIARRARDDNNSESAEKYYDMILVKDPTSWEASFYVVYFRAMGSKIGEIANASMSVISCLETVFKLIKDYAGERAAQVKAVQEVASHCLVISGMLYGAAKKHYDGMSSNVKLNHGQGAIKGCFASMEIGYVLGNCVDDYFGDYDELHACAVAAWKKGIVIHSELIGNLSDRDGNIALISEYEKKVQKYEPNFKAPEAKPAGCYVATAVYGSYNCPQVWTLRRYRDYTLAETWYGRAFIHTYYAISPTLVKWFGDTKWFKNMWKGTLDRMVNHLKEDGVEDTPYEDKKW